MARLLLAKSFSDERYLGANFVLVTISANDAKRWLQLFQVFSNNRLSELRRAHSAEWYENLESLLGSGDEVADSCAMLTEEGGHYRLPDDFQTITEPARTDTHEIRIVGSDALSFCCCYEDTNIRVDSHQLSREVIREISRERPPPKPIGGGT